MNPSNSSAPGHFKTVGSVAALAFAALLAAGLLAPQTAQADSRDHRDDRGRHDAYRHDDRRYRRDWRQPDVVYAPPPVVYRPEPSPGISLFLPIVIR